MVDGREPAGATTVADRVLARIAEQGARGALRGARPGERREARAAVGRAAGAPRVDVRVRAIWPEPAADVARRVAERVRTELSDYAGVGTCTVDVLVDGFDLVPARGGRRVR